MNALSMTCPGDPHCNAAVSDVVFRRFLSGESLAKLQKLRFLHFLMCMKGSIKPCPRAGCNLYVQSSAGDEVRCGLMCLPFRCCSCE